jgi:lipase ATG15
LAVKAYYPHHSNVWMSGHSLGGALASLVALTNGIPAFTYESPGDLLYASRIGLLPRGTPENLDGFLSKQPIFHFGTLGDPIFTGDCVGITSTCYWSGYAMESKCHIGKECIYEQNVKKDLDALQSITYHQIEYVIKNILEPRPVPVCTFKSNCLASECPTWKFV